MLARLGEGHTAPNPMVGAVIVSNDRIIGEGYHHQYKHHHAEVNAIQSVKENDIPKLKNATLYVTLEPCCVHGHTPPCTELIIRSRIPRVVISAIDQSEGVAGRGIHILRTAGITVETDCLKEEGALLAARRNTYVRLKRPYVLLKYAMSVDGFIGHSDQQINLSNPMSWRFVHRLRHMMDAIMVGTDTVLVDDPQLTNRLFGNRQPVRVLLDFNSRIPSTAKVFQQQDALTWVFTSEQSHTPYPQKENIRVFKLNDARNLKSVLNTLAANEVTGLLVEGGKKILQSFLDEGLWDEAIVSVCDVFLGEGVTRPEGLYHPMDQFNIGNDKFYWFLNTHPS